MNRLVLIFCAVLSFISTSAQTKTSLTAKQLYEKNCQRCHGADGAKGSMGAKNLQVSVLKAPEIVSLLQQGKKAMPAYGKKLSAEALNELTAYVKTLRK